MYGAAFLRMKWYIAYMLHGIKDAKEAEHPCSHMIRLALLRCWLPALT